MAVRQTGRKQYRTMQGKAIDMDLLRQRNELTPAVGNVRVNARGDELGPGGKIIKKREEVLRDYYEDNVAPTEFETPTAEPITEPVVEPELREEAKVEETKKTSSVKAKPGKTKAESKEDDWIEDADGNFVKRGA
jgi:hypothetical protein|tara:strand:- start:59 stop:463 length:405 start_codon:yes stop_codon:yes gene_type:complete